MDDSEVFVAARLDALRPAPFVVLCSVNDDPRQPDSALPCGNAPFLAKAAISPWALPDLWLAVARSAAR